MPNENIKYKSDLSKVSVTTIRYNIQSELEDKKTEYDSILESFTISECMQATAIRAMVEKEKELLETLIEFYTQILLMIENAGIDIDETEDAFSVPHLIKNERVQI